MNTWIQRSLLSLGMLGLGMIAWPAGASVYGALYEVGNLTAATGNGSNTEAVLTYVDGEDGFIAITTNTTGETEWWTSDALATTWTRSSVNPLEDYDCTQPGRHGIHTYNGNVYFGANCAAGPTVFEITGLESVELEHVSTSTNELAANYPTAAELNDKLYLFYNGGYSEFDGATWSDVESAPNQPNDAPLEASRQVDGVIYLTFNGQVASFDGSSYEIIGDEYLENVTENDNNNLPAIEYFKDKVYVGNQDFDNGATLFTRDPADTTVDSSNWDVVSDLDPDNTIINKMLLSSSFGGDRYLVYFTSNQDEGVNIFAMDKSETMTELVDAGLGGTDPENNAEVISAIRRTVIDRGSLKSVMIFSTQNTADQTKIFVLNMGKHLAFTPLARFSASSNNQTYSLAAGRRYRVTVPASKVRSGDKYTLYVNGEVVDTVRPHSKRAITLRYKQAEQLEADSEFDVEVGRQLSYGRGDAQLLSRNVIKGSSITVTVQ